MTYTNIYWVSTSVGNLLRDLGASANGPLEPPPSSISRSSRTTWHSSNSACRSMEFMSLTRTNSGSRDLKRYEALRAIGCIACSINGFSAGNAEIHHLVDKGYRKHSGGNQATIPLCPWHH